ncbi:MAG TPA: nucleotidyltransferase [Bdellovibrionota bacterium]|nr:nucleotidyltransferase [Bdellovibrionota bacterium]
MAQLENLLRLLNAYKVRYVIIGAAAFVAHGWFRATRDLDLFVANDDENLVRLRKALSEFGYDLSDATTEDFKKYKILFRQYDFPLDIHPMVKGASSFEGVWKRRKASTIGNVLTNFVSLTDLISMKRAAGRPKDRIDLEQLRKLQRKNSKKGKKRSRPRSN